MGPESEISGSLKDLKPEIWPLSNSLSECLRPSNTLVPIYLARGAISLSLITLPLKKVSVTNIKLIK